MSNNQLPSDLSLSPDQKCFKKNHRKAAQTKYPLEQPNAENSQVLGSLAVGKVRPSQLVSIPCCHSSFLAGSAMLWSKASWKPFVSTEGAKQSHIVVSKVGKMWTTQMDHKVVENWLFEGLGWTAWNLSEWHSSVFDTGLEIVGISPMDVEHGVKVVLSKLWVSLWVKAEGKSSCKRRRIQVQFS